MRSGIWIVGVATGSLVCLGLGGLLVDSGSGTAQASGLAKRFECSDKTIRGSFGGQMQGTRPVPGGTAIESVIGVVTRTYDGAGNFTQVDNVKGSISGYTPDRPGHGTYTINADCTGSTRFEPAPGIVIEERTVIVDYGHEIRSVVTKPQLLMVTASAKRIDYR